MKKIFKLVFTASVLAISLMMNIGAKYEPIYTYSSPIAKGLNYTEEIAVNDSNDKFKFYSMDYKTSNGVFPVFSYGDILHERVRTTTMLSDLSKDGANVAAGINADFFSFQTGIPMGGFVIDGTLICSDTDQNAMGITEGGKIVFGKPQIVTNVIYEKEDLDFKVYYNKYPQVYNVYITDRKYGNRTGSTFECAEIVLEPESPDIKYPGKTKMTVKEIKLGAMDSEIPEGMCVMSVPKTHKCYGTCINLKVGEELTLDVTCSKEFEYCTNIIGGGDLIVKNGVFDKTTVNEDHEKNRYARTAVGQKDDGSLLFLCVNGKISGVSSGMTLKEVAEYLISKGCKTVLNLDGGGSTTIAVKFPGEVSASIKNNPTDGYERGVSNSILFVNTEDNDGNISIVRFNTYQKYVLAGCTFDINPEFYYADATKAVTPNIYYSEYKTEGKGTVVGNKYTAGNESYVEKISGMFDFVDELSGALTNSAEGYGYINVTDKVDSISANIGNILLKPGESVDVDISAKYNGMNVVCDQSQFNVSSTNEAINFKDGKITAGDALFSNGIIEFSHNGVKTDISVAVGKHNEQIFGFEDDSRINKYTAFEKGYNSNYSLTFEGNVDFKTPEKLIYRPDMITLYVKGSFNGASMTFTDADGKNYTLDYELTDDFTTINGWSKIGVKIPGDAKAPITLNNIYFSKTAGFFTIDGLQAVYGYENEYFTDTENHWANDNINVLYEMGVISGSVKDGAPVFLPDNFITRAEFAKIISKFTSGGQETVSSNNPFTDTNTIPSWSADYVSDVYNKGYMKGYNDTNGKLVFNGTGHITRAEVMAVISRVFKLSDDGAITFTDADKIPSWAKDDVIRCVNAGIVSGNPDGTIKAENNVSRAEVAKMLNQVYDKIIMK